MNDKIPGYLTGQDLLPVIVSALTQHPELLEEIAMRCNAAIDNMKQSKVPDEQSGQVEDKLQLFPDDGKLTYTMEEVSKMTSISPTTIWRLREAGKLNYIKIGKKVLFTRQQILDLLKLMER